MTVTRMRERIEKELVYTIQKKNQKVYAVLPPEYQVDKMVALFEVFLAEEKVGNGS